ncbi:putative Type IV pilus biogenesis protein PilC [Crenothrix polyspora]|jgi:type II secretory pathway component PulF|uniref:Putative Type IV pilus biogenesis protein PilC n=1 Tax=Crenothrix polyspora TaxID=360316 RepID=A0A1R4HE74_9GAMM|nr:type II secretion system F family protein [Crenothrix polyspora]SJM94532.1 putative Type IV pilus biogenesis protein PilC [Crenothrix polyspora]
MALEINQKNSTIVVKTDAGKVKLPFGDAKKVADKDRMFFIEQLALMLETGSDLHTSLNVLMKQTDNAELARVIKALCDDISEGKTFSFALAKHPQVFSTTYTSLIAASESGGYIRRILEHLLIMEKQRQALRDTLISAMSYPAFLMVFSLGMVVFILAVVFPKFGTLFTSIQDQLPITTLYLMAISRIITHYWWGIVPGCFGLIAVFSQLIKSEKGRVLIDELKLTTPFIKHIFLKIYLIQMMRILALSLKSGVNLLDALVLTKDVVQNIGFIRFVETLIKDVTEGRKLAYGFNHSGIIPPIVKQMITTGEETGNLALVSDRIADYFQQDLEKLLKLLTKAIEPIMLLVMGVVVGVLVSSLILPIFKLSHAVH